jgi:signal peptidase I
MKIIRFIVGLLSSLVLLVALGASGYFLSIRSGWLPEPVSVSGTGSMYPTFPKGEGTESASLSKQIVATPQMKKFPGGVVIFGRRYFAYSLKRADIVSFENDKTREVSLADTGREAGFLKRLIALPGDELEIRDGFVWLNGQRILEDFTAGARSTFGGKFLADCHKLVIPDGYVFVMGDNRKASNDSRDDIGLVAISDIDHVLPYQDQTQYRALWRDASQDNLLANHPVLDAEEYLRLLNQKRQEYKLSPLKHQPKLDASAAKRASVMLKYNDLSFEATRSGLTMEKAMSQSGYSNIVWGEAPTLGYYDAAELIENFFQFPKSREFLLNADFQETGISAQVGDINGCPAQIVVQHLAGYVPPDYKADVVKSWVDALAQLKQVLPGWEKARDYPEFYDMHKSDIDQVVNLIRQRILRLEAIVSRMQKNEWLNPQEKNWYEEDSSLATQLEALTKKLNNL